MSAGRRAATALTVALLTLGTPLAGSAPAW